MNSIYKYLFAVAAAVLMLSCDSYLDREIVSDVNRERVFSDYQQTYRFVNQIYGYRIDGYSGRMKLESVASLNRSLFGPGMLASASDDAKYSDLSSPINFLANGNWSAVYNPANIWKDSYAAIRATNLFLEESHRMVTSRYELSIRDGNELNESGNLITAEELKNRMTGEVLFLRAYFYYELLRRYGPTPLIDRTYELDEEVPSDRPSFDAHLAFILNDLEQAMTLLPNNYNHYASNRGRATRPMAMAYKAQALLLAASPYFNPSNDSEKWRKAAEAYKAVIDVNAYQLNPSYDRVFVRNLNSVESIHEIINSNRNDIERNHTPVGYEGGSGGINPTQELVDAYEMADGSKFDWSNPDHASNPFRDRDPRFYLSILYNGATWRERPVESYVGGRDGQGVNNATLTGYYFRKFLDPDVDLLRNQTSTKNHLLLRYAEVLLGYAEAQNEYEGPDASVYEAVNRIRSRAGMPALEPGLSQAEMRMKIRNERRVEFAFEGQRFFDVRRWNIATDVFNSPITGLRITQNGGGFQYERIAAENRVFTPNMYLFPIPQNEINSTGGSLQQNPGW
ncbi:RagB/SusD family nutrient uptake outer membrane protein [Belliella marina]|uniref:RagB/SusD family nutrient uptake outer membrane protein n=1 Tax=Belliella marina TaxID=1644146 RepID=A0ABW4VRU3_9BACT